MRIIRLHDEKKASMNSLLMVSSIWYLMLMKAGKKCILLGKTLSSDFRKGY